MAKKDFDVKPEDLDYSDVNAEKQNPATNPFYTAIFNQPADVDGSDTEYKVVLREQLHEFPHHPFKVVVDDEMLDLRDSIIDNGILLPLLVRPRQAGGYEIISGHRRNKAAELAKISEVPVIIKKNLSDAEATIMMVDSNKQRELILPSERAFAYKMKMEAMSRQGRRSDLSGELVDPRSTSDKTRDKLGLEEGMSGKQVSRYVRLTNLIPQLLDLVDNDALKQSPSMALKPAVEISYLTPTEQKFFYDTVKELGKTPSVQQATQIKRLSQDSLLTQTDVIHILMQAKPNQKETVKVDYERLGGYFKESLTPKQAEARVFETLDGMKKIRAAVERHVKGKTLTDEQLANMVEKLLVDYGRSKSGQTPTQTK
ncbi:MAG: ParB/RepB/Spo0J family partition protein [Eubacterium sp.]|nr:ParB/RepB/Spo0J family partition protein [Eubacterium sp.]